MMCILWHWSCICKIRPWAVLTEPVSASNLINLKDPFPIEISVPLNLPRNSLKPNLACIPNVKTTGSLIVITCLGGGVQSRWSIFTSNSPFHTCCPKSAERGGFQTQNRGALGKVDNMYACLYTKKQADSPCELCVRVDKRLRVI